MRQHDAAWLETAEAHVRKEKAGEEGRRVCPHCGRVGGHENTPLLASARRVQRALRS